MDKIKISLALLAALDIDPNEAEEIAVALLDFSDSEKPALSPEEQWKLNRLVELNRMDKLRKTTTDRYGLPIRNSAGEIKSVDILPGNFWLSQPG